MTNFETVLREAQELSPDEQQRLAKLLVGSGLAVPEEVKRFREQVHLRAKTTPEERAAAHAALDHAAAVVGAAWKSDKSALEAVQEQRREL